MKIKCPRFPMFITRGVCICGILAALTAVMYGVDYATSLLLPLLLG